jgi:hypothetical protein
MEVKVNDPQDKAIDWTKVATRSVSAVALLCAAWLAVHGVSGWGWFILCAILAL